MILCLSDLWPPFPGGAERLMFNIARHLEQAGQDIRVLTGYEHARQFDGPAVESMAIGVGLDRASGAASVLDALDAYSPRVVLTHHLYAYAFEDELSTSGVPVVQVVLNGRRLPAASFAVYISEWVRRTLGDAQPDDVVLTPPAFDDVVADSHGDAIGFVKPIPHKGVDLVYRIARAMPRRRFVILRGEWQDLEVIRRTRNITFLEPVEDVREFYAHCRLVLMPSQSEDAGTVAQEATVNGLPCLSTAVGGLAETNAGGVLLDADDVRPWLRAITELDNADAYRKVVQRQREHLERTDHLGTLNRIAERIAAL